MKVYCLRCRKALGKEVVEKYRDIQVVDARYVAGREHLEFALTQAEKAFKRGSNISNDPMMEVLVRASAQRQIKKALELFGVNGSREVYIIGKELPLELIRSYGCEEVEPRISRGKYRRLKEKFGIGEAEIAAVAGRDYEARVEALKNIIKERVALLEVT
jgi:KEOPS complex subunit Cgi121